MVGAFFLLFIGVPVGLALLLGAAFPRRPVLAGLASLAILALLLLLENASQGIVAMLPFALLMGGIAAIPAILAAFLGSRIRLALTRET